MMVRCCIGTVVPTPLCVSDLISLSHFKLPLFVAFPVPEVFLLPLDSRKEKLSGHALMQCAVTSSEPLISSSYVAVPCSQFGEVVSSAIMQPFDVTIVTTSKRDVNPDGIVDAAQCLTAISHQFAGWPRHAGVIDLASLHDQPGSADEFPAHTGHHPATLEVLIRNTVDSAFYKEVVGMLVAALEGAMHTGERHVGLLIFDHQGVRDAVAAGEMWSTILQQVRAFHVTLHHLKSAQFSLCGCQGSCAPCRTRTLGHHGLRPLLQQLLDLFIAEYQPPGMELVAATIGELEPILPEGSRSCPVPGSASQPQASTDAHMATAPRPDRSRSP